MMLRKENQNTEFKETWHDEYLKWICGFANAHGGILYIGIDDDGNISGLPNSRRLLEDIPNKIISLLGIVCDVDLLVENGKEYLRITVPASNVPISYKGTYHYRSGSTKQELTGIALQEFLFKKMGISWDNVACSSATLDSLDDKAIKYFINKALKSGRIPAGFTPQTLLEPHSSKPRNKNIANVFYKAGFIESWGCGIRKIVDGFKTAGFETSSYFDG